jgi:hypothetical protein
MLPADIPDGLPVRPRMSRKSGQEKLVPPAIGPVPAHRHQATGAHTWQRIQHHGVQPTENCGIGSNAEDQGKSSRQRESRAVAQLLDAITDVAAQIVESQVEL